MSFNLVIKSEISGHVKVVGILDFFLMNHPGDSRNKIGIPAMRRNSGNVEHPGSAM